MSGRAGGRLGYGSMDTFDASELNDVYSRGQFWVPGGSLTPDKTSPSTLGDFEPAGANRHTWRVMRFAPSVSNIAFFEWGFKADFVDVTSINIKMSPIWFLETADASKVVRWGADIMNIGLGTSITQGNTGVNMDSDTVAIEVLTGGDSTDIQRAMPTITIGVDALSSTDWNILSCEIEREGDHANDNCLQAVSLTGIGVQFDCDFNNIAAWPTA